MAPGYRADLVLLDDLDQVAVAQVVCGGRLVEAELFAGRRHPEPVGYRSVRRSPVVAAELEPPAPTAATPVIGARPFSLLTDHLVYGDQQMPPLRPCRSSTASFKGGIC